MIKSLHIENFKNLEKFDMTFDKQNFEFHARNGFGKTSIGDAVAWLITGNLMNGNSVKTDANLIKPRGKTNLKTVVELIFDNDFSLRKEFKENWVKTRGTTEVRLEGHVTTCYINGIETDVSKWDNALKDFFKITYDGSWEGNLFQLLIDILYFGSKMDQKDRRKFVIDLVGDVADNDVFKQCPNLLPLQKYLAQAQGKFENVKKLLANNLKDLNGKEQEYKAQINFAVEVTVPKEKHDEVLTEINAINTKIQALSNQKYNGEKEIIAERKNEIAGLKTQLSELKAADMNQYNETVKSQQEQLQKVRSEKTEFETDFRNLLNQNSEISYKKLHLTNEKADLTKKINASNVKKESLRMDWNSLNGSTYDGKANICPNCGFVLNQDEIKKHEEEFNLRKSEKLTRINAEGKALVAETTEAQNRINAITAEEENLQAQYNDLQIKIADGNAKRIELNRKETELNNSIPKYEDSQEVKELARKIFELEAAPYTTPCSTDIDNEIAGLTLRKNQYQKIIDTYNAEQLNVRRAAELQKKLDETMQSIAEFESLQMMLSEFIKTKLQMLNTRIEAVFGNIKIQLIESNIKEGSWNEVCYVLDGEVPYHLTNSAAKIKIGLQVCEAIKKRLGITGLFYLIDNGEQITDREFSKITSEQTITFVAEDVEPQTETNLFNL